MEDSDVVTTFDQTSKHVHSCETRAAYHENLHALISFENYLKKRLTLQVLMRRRRFG